MEKFLKILLLFSLLLVLFLKQFNGQQIILYFMEKLIHIQRNEKKNKNPFLYVIGFQHRMQKIAARNKSWLNTHQLDNLLNALRNMFLRHNCLDLISVKWLTTFKYCRCVNEIYYHKNDIFIFNTLMIIQHVTIRFL